MKKKVKDLTKRQIYEAIYELDKTSVARNNCRFCKYNDLKWCEICCVNEYETCIDYESIIDIVGNEEIEVELDEKES